MLLQGPSAVLLQQLSGGRVVQWLDVETLKVESRRLDLLCKLSDGGLLHIELQSSNDQEMPARMAEYALAIRRRHGTIPRQIVLYVGRGPLRMADFLNEGGMNFRYDLVDFRNLDGDTLLNSPDLGDNVLAVLANLTDRKAAVARIMSRIGRLKTSRRDEAIGQLCVLAGLRGLEQMVQEEVENVPIIVDLMENKIFAKGYERAVAKGLADGMAKGLEKGLAKGVTEGERLLLRRQIAKRFGAIPQSMEERLASGTSEELEFLGLKLLDAQNLADLMG